MLLALPLLSCGQGVGDVEWCLYGDAKSRIDQQPMRDYCPRVMAGALIGSWYDREGAILIQGRTQQQWSRLAARFACDRNPNSQATAVGLLAACQCHNRGAADWIIQNPAMVLQRLRAYAGCN
jgi:hypothetical protein